jgi:hypothetical protein
MKLPKFDFFADLGKGDYMFLIKDAPKWKVVSFSGKNGIVTNKTCKTDARMLRYIRRKTGKLPIIPSMEKKIVLKESWNESDDEFIIFGKNDSP